MEKRNNYCEYHALEFSVNEFRCFFIKIEEYQRQFQDELPFFKGFGLLCPRTCQPGDPKIMDYH